MNDPQLNSCINAVADLLHGDPAREAAVRALVREAFRCGYFNAIQKVDDRIQLLRLGVDIS